MQRFEVLFLFYLTIYEGKESKKFSVYT